MNDKVSIATVTSIAFIFLTLCGALWHLGYWSTFRFNYFQFAPVTDIYKSTIFPYFIRIWIVITMLVSLGIMLYLQDLNIRYFLRIKSPSEKDKQIYHSIEIGFLIISAISVMALFMRNLSYVSCNYFMPVIGLGIGICLAHSRFLIKSIPHFVTRRVLIFVLSLYASSNFFLAKRESLEIKYRSGYRVVTNTSTSDTTLDKKLVGLPFLGSSADYMFFSEDSSNNKILVVQSKEIKHITFGQIANPDNFYKMRELH